MKLVPRWSRCTKCGTLYDHQWSTTWDESYCDPNGTCLHDYQPDEVGEKIEVKV